MFKTCTKRVMNMKTSKPLRTRYKGCPKAPRAINTYRDSGIHDRPQVPSDIHCQGVRAGPKLEVQRSLNSTQTTRPSRSPLWTRTTGRKQGIAARKQHNLAHTYRVHEHCARASLDAKHGQSCCRGRAGCNGRKGVGRCATVCHGSHQRAAHTVLRDRHGGIADARWCGHVVDDDGERLGEGQASIVGHRHLTQDGVCSAMAAASGAEGETQKGRGLPPTASWTRVEDGVKSQQTPT